MKHPDRWLYAVGATLVVAGGLLLHRWYGYGARRAIADELAGDFSPRKANGEAYLVWYGDNRPELSMSDVHYCGVASMPQASRGTTDQVVCSMLPSECMAGAYAEVIGCRSVEVRVLPDGELEVGTPEKPSCSGGLFTSRVCVVRQSVADAAPIVFSVSVR